MFQNDPESLPVGPAEILDKIAGLYDAVCLLDLDRDTLFQLKYPASSVPSLREREIPFSTLLPSIVDALVSPNDQSNVREFLDPEHLRTAFKGINDRQEFAFLSRHDHWKKSVLLPLDYEDGVTHRVLYMHSDHSFSHERYMSIMRECGRLRQLSEHDRLTYLFNRTKLDEMQETEYRELTSCGVLYFDLNMLKEVNDTLGHEAGDALLCQFAESIRSISSHDVHAYRYGGDEFIVIVCNCKEERLDQLLDMWRHRLSHLVKLSGMPCSVAVGQAFSEAPFELEQLIQRADAAMYVNKALTKKAMK